MIVKSGNKRRSINKIDADILIIGAGPAGLCLASELRDTKLKILVLDQKKDARDVKYNTSGSFIDAKEWDLPKSLLNPINKCYFYSQNRQTVKYGKASIIRRRELLQFLENRAKQNPNLRVEYQATIKDIKIDNAKVSEISFEKDAKYYVCRARIYVDCSGASALIVNKVGLSPSKVKLGLGVEYLVPLKTGHDSITLFNSSQFEGGYGWIFPKDKKTAIVGYCTLKKANFKNIEERLKQMWQLKAVSSRCIFEPSETNFGVLRTGGLPRRVTAGNVVAIGDVVLQSNPLAGEGVRFVMAASRLAGCAIKKYFESGDLQSLKGYDRSWRKILKRQRAAFLAQRLAKRFTSSDRFCDYFVKSLDCLSDQHAAKFMRGEFSYGFLLKMILRLT